MCSCIFVNCSVFSPYSLICACACACLCENKQIKLFKMLTDWRLNLIKQLNFTLYLYTTQQVLASMLVWLYKWIIIQQREDQLKRPWLEQLLHPCSLYLTLEKAHIETAFVDRNKWISIKTKEASGENQTSCVEGERYFRWTLSFRQIGIQKMLSDFWQKPRLSGIAVLSWPGNWWMITHWWLRCANLSVYVNYLYIYMFWTMPFARELTWFQSLKTVTNLNVNGKIWKNTHCI